MTDQNLTPENQKGKVGFFRALIPVAVILVGVLIGLSILRSRTNEIELATQAPLGHVDLETGATLPDLDLRLLDDSTRKISQLGAKVLLINFWATWCGPCVQEMPSINRLRREFHPRGFEVVGINVDENPKEVLAEFQKRLGIEFTSYVDPDGKLADAFDVHGIPFTVVIDANRKILAIERGDRDWYASDVRKQVKAWLGET